MLKLSRTKINPILEKILFFIVLIIFIKASVNFFAVALPDIQSFIRLKGNYQELKNQQGIYKIASQLREILSPGSKVYMSDKYSGSIEWIAVRYTLYPSILERNGDYFLDIDHSRRSKFLNQDQRKLAFDVYVYAKPGFSFLKDQAPKQASYLMAFIVWTGFILLQMLLGFSIIRWFELNLNRMGRIWQLLMYYLTGFFALTSTVWIWLVLGGSFHLMIFLFLLFSIILMALFSHLKKPNPYDSNSRSQDPHSASVAIQAIGCIIIAFIALWIISRPAMDWDTLTNWLIKSKVLANEPTLNLNFTKINHNYYPLLWPLNIAIPLFINGGNIDFMAKWTAAFFYITFMSQVYFSLKFLNLKKNFIWIVLIAFSIILVRENPFNSALPESAFLTFMSGLILLIFLWARYPHEKQYMVLAVIFSLTLNLLKIEGVFVSFFIVLSLFAVYFKQFSKRDLICFGSLMLIAALFPFLWLFWSKQLGFWGHILHYQEPLSTSKIILIARLHLAYFLQKGEGLIFVFIFSHLAIIRNQRPWSHAEKFLLYIISFLMLFKWAAVIGWNEQMLTAKTVFPDGQWRLFLHVSPALLLLWSSRAFNRTHTDSNTYSHP
ncbi:MAG: hypothetical protein K8S27_02855 [Candidatus Omnitrophica bacterium]|nr:hypothetical protein [Candidatus Omnitrophota bacterium]